MTDSRFQRRVLAMVRRIPSGRVATYGDVAALAGRPAACRAVGNIMRHCREIDVPCHRVVAAGGRLGGYGDPLAKQALLAAEGVRVSGGRLRGFAAVRWRPGRVETNGSAASSRRTARGAVARRPGS